MYHIAEARIREALEAFLARRGVADVPIVTKRPPAVAMGEVATPVAFELAKRLKRAPKQIAQEIAALVPFARYGKVEVRPLMHEAAHDL